MFRFIYIFLNFGSFLMKMFSYRVLCTVLFLIVFFNFLSYIAFIFCIVQYSQYLHAYFFNHFIACVNLFVFSGLCLKCSELYWVIYLLAVESFALFLRYVYLPTHLGLPTYIVDTSWILHSAHVILQF
jgi:hypothetical protein